MPFLHGLQSLISISIPVQVQWVLVTGIGNLDWSVSHLWCLDRAQYYIPDVCIILLSSKIWRWWQGSMARFELGFGHENSGV